MEEADFYGGDEAAAGGGMEGGGGGGDVEDVLEGFEEAAAGEAGGEAAC